MKTDDEKRKTVVVRAMTEFTDDELKKTKRHDFKMEMLSYNARSLRGDFDDY